MKHHTATDQRRSTTRGTSPPPRSTGLTYRKFATPRASTPSERAVARRSPSTSPRQARSSATRITFAAARVFDMSAIARSDELLESAMLDEPSSCTSTMAAATMRSSASTIASKRIQLRCL
jgi:hypothetical protein